MLVPTQSTSDQTFLVDFTINGQSCSSVGGIYTSNWIRASDGFEIPNDDQTVDIQIQIVWFNDNGYQLDLGLDNLYLWVETPDNINSPLCPPTSTTPVGNP
jgi:hypothetical protein